MKNGNHSQMIKLTSFKNYEVEPAELHHMLPGNITDDVMNDDVMVNSHSITVEDGNIQFPMTVEGFPNYCRNMRKNSGHPFAEEFHV